MKILFLSSTCEDIGVAMVTNMMSQSQERFPRPVLLKFHSQKGLRGAKTIHLPVTFSMSCQIFTSILFASLKNIHEDLLKSRKVMLKNSLKINFKNLSFMQEFHKYL